MTPQELVDHVFAQCRALPAPVVCAYGAQLSKYLHVGIDHVASPDTGAVALLPALVGLDARAREICGFPLLTNAGFRTVAHEQALAGRGYKTAKFVSPHSLGCALDKRGAAPGNRGPHEINLVVQEAYKQAAKALGLPAPRLGHRAYGESFTHVDVVYLLFHPYTDLPHPSTWTELDPEQRHAFTAWAPGVEW